MANVSVILPAYNCGEYIRHTIRSVQNQDYRNWEMIIINDASTDNTAAEIKAFADTDPRIKVITLPENKGVAAARNIGISKAEGRFLAFIDADDLWGKEKLSRQIFFMQKHNAALSHTAFGFIDRDGNMAKQGQSGVDEEIDMKTYMKTSQIRMSSVMIDRKRIKDVHFPADRKICEDARLWMDYLRSGEHFYGLNEVLMLYRVRPKQLSHRKDKMAWAAFKRYMGEKSLSPAERVSCFAHYACSALKIWKPKNNVDIKYIKDNFNCR